MLLPLYGSIRQRLLMMAFDPLAWTMLLLQPLITATVISFMLQSSGRQPDFGRVVVGAAMVTLFGATVLGAAGSIDYERYLGAFPYVALSPAPLFVVVWGKCLAAAIYGLIAATLIGVFSILLFQVPVTIAHPMALVSATVLGVVVLSLFGTCMASLFVLSRATVGLVNVLSYPIWLLSGFFFPIDHLPQILRPISLALPTKWLVDLYRWTTTGMDGDLAAQAWITLLGMSFACFLLGWYLLEHVLRLARHHATLTME